MDVIAWAVAVFALLIAATIVALAPRIARRERARRTAGGGMGGLGAGLDAVWRPSAEEANAEWRAQVEVPAPAPSPGDKGREPGRIDGGRITIEPPRITDRRQTGR
jgi:hypothetical protein